jgi:hypothetical protein
MSIFTSKFDCFIVHHVTANRIIKHTWPYQNNTEILELPKSNLHTMQDDVRFHYRPIHFTPSSCLHNPVALNIYIHQKSIQAYADLKCPLHHECDASDVSYCSSVLEPDDRYGSVWYPHV